MHMGPEGSRSDQFKEVKPWNWRPIYQRRQKRSKTVYAFLGFYFLWPRKFDEKKGFTSDDWTEKEINPCYNPKMEKGKRKKK